MRERKYKVWDKEQMEWIELKGDIFLAYSDGKLEVVEGDVNYAVIHENAEIIEWTGLRDIDNQEIYEGAIVAQFNFESEIFRSEVIFRDGSFGYKNKVFGDFIAYASNNAFNWENGRSTRIKIIGHIFENPELLEG